MKKFLSVILASLVIAAAGCSGNETAATTTTTAETTNTAEATTTAAAATEAATEAVTETETTEAETSAMPDDSFLSDEEKVFIGKLRTEAPVYAEFYAANLNFPVTVKFYVNNFLFEGKPTKATMEIGMASPSSSYVIIDPEITDANIISIFKDGMHYNMIPETQTVFYTEMKSETAHRMISYMTADLTPSFDPFTATYKTGESRLDGEPYFYEKIETEEIGEIMVYADIETKELRHIISGNVTLTDINVSNTIDYSKLEIPAEYTIVDMAELMPAQ